MPSENPDTLNPYAPPKSSGDDEKPGRWSRYGKLVVEWAICFTFTAFFVYSFVSDVSTVEKIVWYIGAALSCVVPAHAAVSVHSRFRRGFVQSMMAALVSGVITMGLILVFYMLIVVL